eukprot:gene7168-biopygen22505
MCLTYLQLLTSAASPQLPHLALLCSKIWLTLSPREPLDFLGSCSESRRFCLHPLVEEQEADALARRAGRRPQALRDEARQAAARAGDLRSIAFVQCLARRIRNI